MKAFYRAVVFAAISISFISACKTTSRRTTQSQKKAKVKSHKPNDSEFSIPEVKLNVATDSSAPSNEVTKPELTTDIVSSPVSEIQPNSEVQSVGLAANPASGSLLAPYNANLPPPEPVAVVPVEINHGPADFDKICDELKGKFFQREAISPQIRWLCDLGGFSTLSAASVNGSGPVREYFEEYNQTMYYAAGLSSSGSLEKASSIGKLFCSNYKGVRTRGGSDANESISGSHASAENGECEYVQEENQYWGNKFDLLATKKYGKLEGQGAGKNIYWQVDSMVAPLNYSALKQYSSLVLFWETNEKIKGVVLTMTRLKVDGAVLGVTRTKLKATMASLVNSYANEVK